MATARGYAARVSYFLGYHHQQRSPAHDEHDRRCCDDTDHQPSSGRYSTPNLGDGNDCEQPTCRQQEVTAVAIRRGRLLSNALKRSLCCAKRLPACGRTDDSPARRLSDAGRAEGATAVDASANCIRLVVLEAFHARRSVESHLSDPKPQAPARATAQLRRGAAWRRRGSRSPMSHLASQFLVSCFQAMHCKARPPASVV